METKTLTTPSGHKVEYKAWLTGRERREIQNVFLEGMKVNVQTGETQDVSPDLANKAQDKTIELMIVSVDGVKEGILDKVLDMKSKDFDAVINALNKLETSKKK